MSSSVFKKSRSTFQVFDKENTFIGEYVEEKYLVAFLSKIDARFCSVYKTVAGKQENVTDQFIGQQSNLNGE